MVAIPILVATSIIVGFVWLITKDNEAEYEEYHVLPPFMREGDDE